MREGATPPKIDIALVAPVRDPDGTALQYSDASSIADGKIAVTRSSVRENFKIPSANLREPASGHLH